MAGAAQLAALGERGEALLRGQHATERTVAGVQAMKAELARGRREKREREVAFLQAQSAPLVERLVALRDEGEGAASHALGKTSASPARPDVQALQAVVRESMHRARAAEAAGLASSARLCAGADVQRSACGNKMRIIIDASHLGARLERYAIILQLRSEAACGAAPTSAADEVVPEVPGENDATDGEPRHKHLRGAAGGRPVGSCHEATADGGVTGGVGEGVGRITRWEVREHSLPKFIPVAALAARHLPTSLRSFMGHVQDYVQALAARREQWLELVRLYSHDTDISSEPSLRRHGAAAAHRPFRVLDPRRSDAYDQLSFTIAPTGSDGAGVLGQNVCRQRGEQASQGSREAAATRFSVQLVCADLRRCFPSAASIQGVDAEGGEYVLQPEDQRRAQAHLLHAGQRLADAVPRLFTSLSSGSWP